MKVTTNSADFFGPAGRKFTTDDPFGLVVLVCLKLVNDFLIR